MICHDCDLKKELDLYSSLTKEKFASSSKAEKFLDMVLIERTKITSTELKRQKYNTGYEMSRHYLFLFLLGHYLLH